VTVPTMLTARWVVVDIEGTLIPTSQVHVVLYDYARPRLGPWIVDHAADPVVQDAVARVRELGGLVADASVDSIVTVLQGWMDSDQKIAPLKTLQGLIWQHGYAEGHLVTEFFPDVVPALRGWHDKGLDLAVFSSGSVAGQVASFTRTTDGDVTGLFAAHFDTVNAGPKREAGSYARIAKALEAPEIVFFSDVPAELDAAAADGWQTVGLARPGEPFGDADFGRHLTIQSFAEVDVELA
jgi:enolase-phosphatase E1